MKERVDLLLAKSGMVASRSQAAQYIQKGAVFYNGQLVTKTSQKVTVDGLEIKKDIQYVSRGAYKIEAAITKFNLEVKGYSIADIGASTGGFTDYLLKQGAKKIFAIDVGHNQLAKVLREDPRVINMEGINMRDQLLLDSQVDLSVVDISFISLRLVLQNIFDLTKKNGNIVVLYKPQFEVGREGLDKKGVVKNSETRLSSLEDFYHWCLNKNFLIANFIRSPLPGKTGNIEYLFHFKTENIKHSLSWEEIISMESVL